MPTVIDAVFENGVLIPVAATLLKEHQRYRLILEEAPPGRIDDLVIDPLLAAEIKRRTTILPDGRTIVRLGGILAPYLPSDSEVADQLAEALAEVRRDREKHFQEELDEFFPVPPEPQ